MVFVLNKKKFRIRVRDQIRFLIVLGCCFRLQEEKNMDKSQEVRLVLDDIGKKTEEREKKSRGS